MERTEAKKQIACVVTSDSMKKSRVAKLERRIKHPGVGKYIKKTTKFMFHDEREESFVGDEVIIEQTRPLSKRKAFDLVKVTKKNTKV